MSLAEAKTPAGIADGGVTPANIRARGADPGSGPTMPEAARARKRQIDADDAEYRQVGDEPASAGKYEQPGAMGGGSAGRVSSRQGSGTRGTRTLVPLPGQDRQGSRPRRSREGTAAGATPSRTRTSEVEEAAAGYLSAQRPGRRGHPGDRSSRPAHISLNSNLAGGDPSAGALQHSYAEHSSDMTGSQQ